MKKFRLVSNLLMDKDRGFCSKYQFVEADSFDEVIQEIECRLVHWYQRCFQSCIYRGGCGMKDASKLVLFIIMAMSIVSLIISLPTLIVTILMGINYLALRALIVVIMGTIIFSIAWVILNNQMDKELQKIDEELAEHKSKMEQLDKEFDERQKRVADRFKNLR